MNVDAPAIAEVVRLHDFFTAWYEGEPGRSINEFSDALDERFTIVGPGGSLMRYEAIIAVVEAGRGRHGGAITVENFDVVDLDAAVVCRYDEVQVGSGGATRRISSAVMVPDTATPGGFRWIAVHETWAPA